MKTLNDSQRAQVREVLSRSGIAWNCPACAKGKLMVLPHLLGLPEVISALEPGSQGPQVQGTGRSVRFVMLTCDNCGYAQLHSLVNLKLDEMVG